MAEQVSDSADGPGGSGALMPLLLDEARRAVAEVVQPHLKAPMVARISALRPDGDPDAAAREVADAR